MSFLSRIYRIDQPGKDGVRTAYWDISTCSITKAQAAIFDNVEGNEALTLALDEGIGSVKQDGWKTIGSEKVC